MKKILREWLLPPAIFILVKSFIFKIKSFIKYNNIDFAKNNELENIHLGKRCFIVGTGPSINEQDLTLLENEITIGISGLFNHKDISKIKPNYYVLAPVFEYHLKYNKAENYINWLKEMDKKLPNDVIMIVHIGDKKYIEDNNIFSNKKIYWKKYVAWNKKEIHNINLEQIPDISSVSETAVHVALYLGFDKIYMLGFDHNWFEDLHVYFDSKEYNKYFENIGKKAVEKFGFDSEFQMERHAKIFNKYKKYYKLKKNIYNANANPDSYVDTFPKVKFESLFEK